jgi:hypothetical protein
MYTGPSVSGGFPDVLTSHLYLPNLEIAANKPDPARGYYDNPTDSCLTKLNHIDLSKKDTRWDSVTSAFVSKPHEYHDFLAFADKLSERQPPAATPPPVQSAVPAPSTSSLSDLTAQVDSSYPSPNPMATPSVLVYVNVTLHLLDRRLGPRRCYSVTEHIISLARARG